MEVKLLKDLINQVIKEQNETAGEGIFWCFAPDYDECIPVFKEIFFDEKIKQVTSKECNIQRVNGQFLVEDPYDEKDFFTIDEVYLFITLWEKAQKSVVNYVEIYPK